MTKYGSIKQNKTQNNFKISKKENNNSINMNMNINNNKNNNGNDNNDVTDFDKNLEL